MTTFDNAIRDAKGVIKGWSGFSQLKEVTIVRDVFGKLAFVFAESAATDRQSLERSLKKALGDYYSGHVFWDGENYNDLTRMLLREISSKRHPDKTEQDHAWYFLERPIAKKARLDCSGKEKPVWPYQDAVDGLKPKVVTFYSFKGGMGRTTALAAMALLLAKHGRNILAIDTDVEAPGLATLFFDQSKIRDGTIDFFLRASIGDQRTIDMRDYLQEITDPLLRDEKDGHIFIVPAGRVDSGYLQKLGRIDYQEAVENSMRNRLTQLISNATSFTRENGFPVDYVLLDARAGFHDMGGVVTTHLPHAAVVFGKDNEQSWNGLREVVRALATTQTERQEMAIVSSMAGTEKGERERFKSGAYTLCCDEYYSADDMPGLESDDVAHSPIYLPYDVRLSSNVQLHSNGTPEENEAVELTKRSLCSEEYRALEKRIRQWFDDDKERAHEQL